MKASKGFFVLQDLIIFLLCVLLLLSAVRNMREAIELQLTLLELSHGIMLSNSAEIGEEVDKDGLIVEIINAAQSGSPYKEINISNNKKLLFNVYLAK